MQHFALHPTYHHYKCTISLGTSASTTTSSRSSGSVQRGNSSPNWTLREYKLQWQVSTRWSQTRRKQSLHKTGETTRNYKLLKARCRSTHSLDARRLHLVKMIFASHSAHSRASSARNTCQTPSSQSDHLRTRYLARVDGPPRTLVSYHSARKICGN